MIQFTDILNNTFDVPCMGCAIGDGSIIPPGGIICATEHFVLHQDPLIPIAGFLIVASKAHLRSIADFEEPDRREWAELVYQGVKALKTAGITQEVTLVQEERSHHFHTWLFPWHAWMDTAGFTRSVKHVRDIIGYAIENRSDPEEVGLVLAALQMIQEHL